MVMQSVIQRVVVLGSIFVSHLILWPSMAPICWLTWSVFIGLCFLYRAWDVLLLPCLLLLMATTGFYFPSEIARWPVFPFLIPFILTVLIALPFAPLRKNLSWFKFGQIDRTSVCVLIGTSLVATGALILWGLWTDALALILIFARVMHNYSSWLVLGVAIPVFALLNAFAEEVVYRGVVQESFARAFGEKHFLTLILPAAAFAAAHVAVGFPNGKVGYVMVLIYGVMLGWLRRRTKGMMAPYLAHVLADLTIGYFLFFRTL